MQPPCGAARKSFHGNLLGVHPESVFCRYTSYAGRTSSVHGKASCIVMDNDERQKLSTSQKALRINLDPLFYGTFAEIGAGQEVARWFFKVGGAAGTISKSISAYDMAVSDAIYGCCKRYVSRERLQGMLDHEHSLNIERLQSTRRDSTA